jgi:hypothetical protein
MTGASGPHPAKISIRDVSTARMAIVLFIVYSLPFLLFVKAFFLFPIVAKNPPNVNTKYRRKEREICGTFHYRPAFKKH